MNEPPRYRWLVVLGFAFALVAMVLGLLFAAIPIVIGGVLATSGRRRAGIALIVTAVVLVGAPRLGLLVYSDAVGGKTYRVGNGAMTPTLRVGDRLFAQDDGSPGRGDIYVHREPVGCGARHWGDQPCARPGRLAGGVGIHRVVALPGERVKVIANRVYVDGRRLDEPYAKTAPCFLAVCELPREVRIRPGHYFVVGDNRGERSDSRLWGPIPKAWLLKRVSFRYRPLDRLGSL